MFSFVCDCAICKKEISNGKNKTSKYTGKNLCIECFNLENQNECDHDWEEFDTYEQCTYPDCQKKRTIE